MGKLGISVAETLCWLMFVVLSLFSTWRLYSRDAKRKQESGNVIGSNWLAKKFAANK